MASLGKRRRTILENTCNHPEEQRLEKFRRLETPSSAGPEEVEVCPVGANVAERPNNWERAGADGTATAVETTA